MKESKNQNLITKSLTLVLPAFFLLFWSMLHNSNITSNTKTIFHINNGLLVMVLTIGTFLIVMKDNFSKAIVQARLEQQNDDYNTIIEYLEWRINDLTEKYNLSKEKTNVLLSKLKYLNQLTIKPDFALFLIKIVLNTIEQYKVDFNVQITGNIDSLKNIQVEDLKQGIEMMLVPIHNHFNNLDENQHKGDINLFIIEKNNKIRFQVIHDYVGDQINIEMLEWNVKKILHKYEGDFKVEHEQEEENLKVLTLTLDISKVQKSKISKSA